MARKKLALAYITNEATRRATLKKRRHGLMKKVRELSILCGVPICAVVYSPHDDNPEIYPSQEEAKFLFTELENIPEMDRNKKTVNQITFLEQRLLKLNQQIRRLEHENKELASATHLRRCLSGHPVEKLNAEDANALLDKIDRWLKAVETRMHQLGAPPVPNELQTPYLELPASFLDLPVPLLERPAPNLSLPAPCFSEFSFDAAAIEAMQQYNLIGGSGGGLAGGSGSR